MKIGSWSTAFGRSRASWRGATLHVPAILRLETLVVAFIMLGLSLTAPAPAGARVRSGFTDSLVVSVEAPTDFTFTPGKRLIVSTQGGVLYLRASGGLTPILDLSNVVCSDFERGLLGVVLDPSFSTNKYVYVYYTFAKSGSCAYNSPSSPVNRVSRFVWSGSTIDRESEVVLIDNILSLGGNHNAGDLLFGKDGYLYVTVGDSGCELNNASRCGSQNRNARQRNLLNGKVLRITRDGGIPSSNPFVGSDSGRCNVSGRTSRTYCRETFVWGFRNPFRIALDPNSSSTRIYINDVGQNTWEEIDAMVAGSDYGWNVREGFCATGSTSNCGSPPSGMRNPIFAYGRGNGCGSITGGAFVPNNVWPSSYNGAYLYGDYVCGKIFVLKGSSSSEFASNLGGVTTLHFGPYGDGQALYYATFNGQIRRITSNSNRAPVAAAEADPQYGMPPLEVSFDGSASTDSDNDSLSYEWNFGDGSPKGSGVKTKHMFADEKDGGYDVTLTVKDGQGASNSTVINVDVGNMPPTPVIESPLTTDRFSVGQQITLHGSASDVQEGDISASTLKWNVRIHHGTHEHPFFSGTGNDLTFNAPAPEDLLAATNSYLVVSLTATDATGLSSTVTRHLLPDKVQLTIDTNPTGLTVLIEDQPFTAPATVTSWAGNPLDLSAPSQVLPSGEPVVWSSWSVPGSQSFQIVTPADNATVTADFALVTGPAFAPVADARVRESSPSANEGKVTGLSSKGGTTSDYESFLRFDVTGISGQVTSATLYLFAYEGTSDGPRVYKTSNDWGETSIAWSNRPTSSGGALDDASAVAARTWVTLDVTSAITGNGTVSFLLRSTSTDAISVYSREAPSRQPRLVIVTNGAGDATAPSAPTGLTADAPASDVVDLAWTASSDDVGVTGYDVYRDGKFLTSVGATTYADTSVAPNHQYSYQVRARDAAGNRSELSESVVSSTPPTTATLTLAPAADARVVESTPDQNYGRSSELRAEGGSDPDTLSYLRFDVPAGLSGTVYRATLRVFVPAKSGYGTVDGPGLFNCSGTQWSETTVNWNRQLACSSLIDDAGAVEAGAWVDYDVTAMVTTQKRTYTFALVSASTDVVVFSSREGATPPQLMITVANGTVPATAADVTESPAPTAVSTPEATSTPTATPTPSPSSESTPTATETATATPTDTPTSVAEPVLPFADGFESGDLSSWTDSTGFQTTQAVAASGAWAGLARSQGAPNAPDTGAIASKSLGEESRELYVKTSVYLDAQGDNQVDLISVADSRGRPLVTLLVDDDGVLAIRNERTSRLARSVELTPDEWHEVQVHVVANGNDSLVELWLDGRLIERRSEALANQAIAAFTIGDGHVDRTFAMAYDDVRADKTCIGTCSTELVTPEPASTPTPTETEPAATETSEPTTTETSSPTPEPTETQPPEPTETPTAEPTESVPPTDEVATEPATEEPTATNDDG